MLVVVPRMRGGGSPALTSRGMLAATPGTFEQPQRPRRGAAITRDTINSDAYGANTCVRIAYKAFQMEECDIPYSLGNIDFTSGIIAVSGKKNLMS